MNTTRRTITAVLLGAACVLSACRTSRAPTNHEVHDGPWLMPSPILQEQLEDEAQRLPWTHGFERLEQIRWFALVGEPAYETLLELALDPRQDVASAALAALGETNDRRLVPFIHRLDWSEERLSGDLGLERARTLLRLGDWSEIPTLIAGLSDERLYTRSLCLEALKGATGQTLGYDPRAEVVDRDRAVDSWRVWWNARAGEGLLGA